MATTDPETSNRVLAVAVASAEIILLSSAGKRVNKIPDEPSISQSLRGAFEGVAAFWHRLTLCYDQLQVPKAVQQQSLSPQLPNTLVKPRAARENN